MFIDSSKVDATLTDFPVTIILSIASGIGDADVSAVFDELTSDANRFKIAVTDENNQQLYVEIESWDDATETAVLHVKVPSISSSANTILYLYYDSAQADNTSYVGDTTDAVTHNVWDSDFKSVYHMNQTPTPGADVIKDSTVSLHDMTVVGTPSLMDGQTGKAVDFALNDYGYDHHTAILYLPYTIESLSKTAGVGGSNMVGQFQSNSFQWKASYFDATNHAIGRFAYELENELSTGATAFPNNTWVYTAFVCESVSSRKIYANGVQDGINTNTVTDASSGNIVSLGRMDLKYATNYPAIIDEVRFSSTARSAAWVKATYNSLWDSLITFS